MREYRTLSGDMWDMIAFRLYPDGSRERAMANLIEANDEYAAVCVFGAGVTLLVPDEEYRQAEILPPWRR